MPPSLREWLPEDHLAWFVLEAVEEMDLTGFYADYRSDGHGRAAYEPSMMVALLLYAYATEQRSSRGIEIHCRQDIAYRVIAANRVPDHATIARFSPATRRRSRGCSARCFGSARRRGWSAPGWWRSTARSSMRTPAARRTSTTSGSRARSSPRRRRSTRPRTSASARRAATSCLPSFGRARAAGSGLPRPSRRSMPSRRRIRRRPLQSPSMSRPRCRVAGLLTRAGARRPPTPRRAPCPASAPGRALARGAAVGVKAPARGGACGRATGERGL
jgi:Transposase domain (DUF772)